MCRKFVVRLYFEQGGCAPHDSSRARVRTASEGVCGHESDHWVACSRLNRLHLNPLQPDFDLLPSLVAWVFGLWCWFCDVGDRCCWSHSTRVDRDADVLRCVRCYDLDCSDSLQFNKIQSGPFTPWLACAARVALLVHLTECSAHL